MRRCLSLAIAALALSVPLAAAPAGAGAFARAATRPGPPAVHAMAAALYDPGAHRFLWSDHPDLGVPVASLTKLMTAWLALRQPDSTPVTVGPSGPLPPGRAAGARTCRAPRRRIPDRRPLRAPSRPPRAPNR